MDRLESLKRRWDNLKITEEILQAAAPQFKDPKVYFQKLIVEEKNYDLASKRLTILESLIIKDKQELLLIEVEKVWIKRNEQLVKSDFSQLPDVPLTSEEKKKYREYRQYLRDLPELVLHQKKHIGPIEFIEYVDWKEKTKYE